MRRSEECQRPQPLLFSKELCQSVCIAVHLQCVLQCTFNLHCSSAHFLDNEDVKRLSKPLICSAVHHPFASQCFSHVCCSACPMCMTVLLGKYWGLGSPASSVHDASWGRQRGSQCSPVLLFAPTVPLMHTSQRGSMVVSYLCTVIAGGYEGGRVFRWFGGQHWKRTSCFEHAVQRQGNCSRRAIGVVNCQQEVKYVCAWG